MGDSEIGEGDEQRALQEKLSRLVNMPADAFVEQMSADPERFQRWIMQRAAQAQAQAQAARARGGLLQAELRFLPPHGLRGVLAFQRA